VKQFLINALRRRLKSRLIMMAQNRSKKLSLNKRNPIAKALKFFTPKVIKDKTKYNRKKDEQKWKRYIWKGL